MLAVGIGPGGRIVARIHGREVFLEPARVTSSRHVAVAWRERAEWSRSRSRSRSKVRVSRRVVRAVALAMSHADWPLDALRRLMQTEASLDPIYFHPRWPCFFR
jgi:hypothetical protein